MRLSPPLRPHRVSSTGRSIEGCVAGVYCWSETCEVLVYWGTWRGPSIRNEEMSRGTYTIDNCILVIDRGGVLEEL